MEKTITKKLIYSTRRFASRLTIFSSAAFFPVFRKQSRLISEQLWAKLRDETFCSFLDEMRRDNVIWRIYPVEDSRTMSTAAKKRSEIIHEEVIQVDNVQRDWRLSWKLRWNILWIFYCVVFAWMKVAVDFFFVISERRDEMHLTSIQLLFVVESE